MVSGAKAVIAPRLSTNASDGSSLIKLRIAPQSLVTANVQSRMKQSPPANTWPAIRVCNAQSLVGTVLRRRTLLADRVQPLVAISPTADSMRVRESEGDS
jgi:hypothetical protein